MRAFIFDFDGVIVDSQQYWDRLSLEHMQKLLPDWTAEDDRKMKGHSMTDNYDLLVREYGVTFPRETFIGHVEEIGREVYAEHAKINHGILQLFDRLATFPIPKPSIASASRHDWLKIIFDRLDLARHFIHVTTTEEVPRGKPHPDVYLKAAEKIGFAPKDCIAVEDTEPGMLAAHRAGMFCIGYHPIGHPREELSHANLHIESFDQLTAEKLAELLR